MTKIIFKEICLKYVSIKIIVMKKKFKTLKLLIVFAIIIFIFINIYKSFVNLVRNKDGDDIVTNMLIIQGRIKVINGEIKVNSEEYKYVGTKVSEIDNDELKEKIKNIGIEESQYEEYYVLTKENYSEMGIADELKKADDNQYLVNYNNVDVIYIDGITIKNEKKYKLSDIKAKQEKKKWILYNKIENTSISYT